MFCRACSSGGQWHCVKLIIIQSAPGEKQEIVSVMKSERRGGPGHQHFDGWRTNAPRSWPASRSRRMPALLGASRGADRVLQ